VNVRILMVVSLLWLSGHALGEGADVAHLRVLEASCAACHGYNGNSVGGTPVLAALDRSHFILQMQSFRNGARSSTVMHHHAKGLTDAEIEQLADYFSAQPRATVAAPQPLGGL
jgi:cytochrome subunit of sulfide dehydrogenase